jgi:hypothetical protein
MVTLNLLGLNTSTTCFKLHDLHKELNQQNQGATEAYGRPILNQLLKLIENKDKQVKILACCCLAGMDLMQSFYVDLLLDVRYF